MEFDVVVVGAGPAGSMAAWAAAEAGCDVLILERKAEVGTPKQCAEGIGARALEEAGIKPDDSWIAARVERGVLSLPDGSKFEVEVDGFVLERRVFDKWLFVRAVEAGAEVELLACARRALVEDGRVVGVEYESVNGVREVRARVTIAADGIESRVGRTAGLTPPLKPHQICTCAQYEVVGDRHDPKAFVIHFDPDRIPGGYAWVFPKGENRANVGVGIRGSKSRPGSALETLDELIEGPLSELVSGTPVEVNVGGVPVCGPVERSYGDGILLVGDAARQVNPVTGGGLHTALVCGRIAGEVAAEAIEENDTTASFLKQYQDRWKEEFGDTFECARDVAEILPELDLEEVVEFLSSVEDLDELLRTSGILEDVWWD